MKKALFLFLLTLVTWSCDIDDSRNTSFHYEILPIENVTFPVQEFVIGESYLIEYSYLRPPSCHFYNDLYYVIDGNKRNVAVINTVFDESTCNELENEIEEQSFTFHALQDVEFYEFRFWNGQDENGEDLFLTFEIPVVQ
jgi:hypothetical protein